MLKKPKYKPCEKDCQEVTCGNCKSKSIIKKKHTVWLCYECDMFNEVITVVNNDKREKKSFYILNAKEDNRVKRALFKEKHRALFTDNDDPANYK